MGVELGQLNVIAIAFLAIGYWFGDKPWYRTRTAIAAVGTWWFIEWVFL